MAIGPILSELWPAITQQQGQKVVVAFVSTQGGLGGSNIPVGMTNAQFAELCIKRFIKSVVKGSDRATAEATLAPLNQATDQEFPE